MKSKKIIKALKTMKKFCKQHPCSQCPFKCVPPFEGIECDIAKDIPSRYSISDLKAKIKEQEKE